MVVSLANTQEPLFLVNRSGNRPSHELAASFIDQAGRPVPAGRLPLVPLPRRHRLHPDQAPRPLGRCRGHSLPLRHRRPAQPGRAGRATAGVGLQLPGAARSVRSRPSRDSDPERHKARIVRERGFETIHTLEEMVAEFRLSSGGLQPGLSRDRAPQAAGHRQGTVAAVRGVSLLLLHHQRSR